MIYIISMIVVLSILVFVHELGALLAAKMFGVRVERFSIGFPPRLFGVQYGETDYCIFRQRRWADM
ncbi:MAG: site-2 protease family protein [Calditrichia bacterium]